jgi:hypothetical protein
VAIVAFSCCKNNHFPQIHISTLPNHAFFVSLQCQTTKFKQYELVFEGNSSHNADDGFCGGVWQAACGTSKTSSRGGC